MLSAVCRSFARSQHLKQSCRNTNIILEQRNFNAFNRLQKPLLQNAKERFESRREIHPLFIIFARQIAKVIAILTGRGIRKWWTSLPPDKKRYLFKQIGKNKMPILVGCGGVTSMFGIYYGLHIQEAPITGRKRFIAFNPAQMDELSKFEFETQYENWKNKVYPKGHIFTRRVQAVAERLLAANRDIKEVYSKNWAVIVVNSPMQNAFVLPNGHIFVFSGMLGLCENDDQLACVLAHEISHAILNHTAEIFSYGYLLDIPVVFILTAIWAIIPTAAMAAITHFLFNKVMEVTLTLPYSRKLEVEADLVGLEMAAKACFDVRESSAFWAKMTLINDQHGEEEFAEFLSSHPTNSSRTETLDAMMPHALEKRVECRCPPLPRRDPRSSVDALRRQIEAARKWREEIARSGVVAIKVPD